MNCLIIGNELSEAQLETFAQAGFTSVETVTKLPARPKKKAYALVLYAPRAQPDEGKLAKFHQLFGKSWTVLSAKKIWFAKEEFQAAVNATPLSDIWLREGLDVCLPHGLLRWQRLIEQQDQISSLKEEIRQLKSDCDGLSEQSGQLVKQLERDILLATSIQRAVIPRSLPNIPGIRVRSKYVPSGGKGGDYFNVFEFGDRKRFGILMADSKSHGMAAALLSVLIKLRLDEVKERFTDSKSFVEHLNQEIQKLQQKDISEMSLLYGIFERGTLSFQYTVAGSLRPLLWRMGEAPPLNAPANPPVGNVDNYAYKEASLSLKPGDLLFFATDGLDQVLQTGAQEGATTTETVVSLLSANDVLPDPLEIQNQLMAQVDRYQETQPLPDDITILQIEVEENAFYLAKKKG